MGLARGGVSRPCEAGGATIVAGDGRGAYARRQARRDSAKHRARRAGETGALAGALPVESIDSCHAASNSTRPAPRAYIGSGTDGACRSTGSPTRTKGPVACGRCVASPRETDDSRRHTGGERRSDVCQCETDSNDLLRTVVQGFRAASRQHDGACGFGARCAAEAPRA